MSPLEYIEESIRQGNWEMVCEGYKRLTGVALLVPDQAITTKETENALYKIADIVSNTLRKSILYIKPEKLPQKRKGRPKKKSTTIDDEEDTTLILDGQTNTPVTQKTSGTQLITNKPDPKEIEKNKARAIKAQPNKLKLNRSPVCTFDVKCNECEEVFQSDRPDGELGQKCSTCLKEKKNRLT